MNSKKIVSAGHICLDITPVFPQGKKYDDIASILIPGKLINMEKADVHTGGSVANTGLALKKLGCDVRLLGKIGDDPFGEMIKTIVEGYGAGGLIADPDSSTSYSVVLAVPGTDRVFLHNPGANDTFRCEDIPDDVLEDAVLFHFGYPTLMKHMYEDNGEELMRLFQRVKAQGIATSLDLAAVDPDSASGKADWETILAKTLPYVDFFVPSFEELCFMLDRERYDHLASRGTDMAGIIDIEKDVLPLAKRSIECGCKAVLIKCGIKGMFYLTSDSTGISQIGHRLGIDTEKWSSRSGMQPCYKADVVRSGTGAGDTSIAAFLAALIQGMDPEKCVSLACAEGACCVTAYDALSGIKALEELDALIARGWEQLAVD